MDAAALLQSQGWRGHGHTLHPSDNGVGLSKPLGLSRNTDRHGIGKPKHHTSDQWWLVALDEKLKGLDTSNKGKVVQSMTTGKLDAVAMTTAGGRVGKYAGVNGLYAMFVRGGQLAGTRDEENTTDSTPGSERDPDASLRLNGSSVPDSEETREERKKKRAERRLRKQARALRRVEKALRRKERADAEVETRHVHILDRKVRKEKRRKRRTLEDGSRNAASSASL